MIPEVYFILGVSPYAVACLCLYVLARKFLSPLTAFAEVGLPPPVQHQNAGFPSDQALQRRGYDPKTGILES